MFIKTLTLTEPLYEYLIKVSLRESDVLRRLREETMLHPMARMQVAPEQGQFMALLVELLGARRVIEIGTYTGYSALCMAAALPAEGHLVACDINAEWTAIGQRYWREAGVTDKIQLRLAPAVETLAELLSLKEAGTFDFAFIDADKVNYNHYYEHCLKLLRPGGLIAIDNVLWSGRVIDPLDQDPDTLAIHALNTKLRDDERVSLSMLPISDGLTLARKR